MWFTAVVRFYDSNYRSASQNYTLFLLRHKDTLPV